MIKIKHRTTVYFNNPVKIKSMKRFSILLLASSALSSPFAAADTLYYEGWGYWNVPSHWWSDASGTPAGRVPTADTDVVVSGVELRDNSTQINTEGVDTIKSLTFDGTQTFGNAQNIYFHDGFTISGDFYYANSGTGNMLAFIGANYEFNVGGSFTVDASSNKGKSWIAFFRQTTADSRIGALNIKNGLEIIGGTGNIAALTLNAKETFVTGKVRLANSNSVLNLTRAIKTDDTFTNNFTCDGLDGAGKLTIGATSYGGTGGTPTVIQNMIFTNSTDSSFSGVSKGQFNDPVGNITDASELNIEMNAVNAGAIQTLRLKQGAYATVADNISVRNGYLNLYGDTAFRTLSVSGGRFGAATASDPGETAPDIGSVAFESGAWSGGAIVFDISTADASFDKISFSGTFDKAEGADISLQFEFDADGMRELIEMGVSAFEDMITYAEGSSVEGTVLSGVSNGFSYEAVFGATGMDVAFARIPEPAAFAAAFGGLALALAVRRARK